MQKTLWSLFACLACSSVALFSMSSANAASVKAQGPCAYTNGLCATFGFDAVIPTIGSYTFTVPAAGATAIITFNGTMQCAANGPFADEFHDVIDLASQIVTTPNAIPAYTGPGGQRYAMRLHFGNPDSNTPSTTVNLATTRTIRYNSGGAKSVFYKFNRLRMDSGTRCNVFAAAFTVLITP
jgi:hypothetical protein